MLETALILHKLTRSCALVPWGGPASQCRTQSSNSGEKAGPIWADARITQKKTIINHIMKHIMKQNYHQPLSANYLLNKPAHLRLIAVRCSSTPQAAAPLCPWLPLASVQRDLPQLLVVCHNGCGFKFWLMVSTHLRNSSQPTNHLIILAKMAKPTGQKCQRFPDHFRTIPWNCLGQASNQRFQMPAAVDCSPC